MYISIIHTQTDIWGRKGGAGEGGGEGGRGGGRGEEGRGGGRGGGGGGEMTTKDDCNRK